MGFFGKWVQGIKDITPVQQLQARYVGQIGATIGLILATVVMAFRGVWYLLLFLACLTFLQGLQAIAARQQYIQTKSLLEGTEEGGNKNGI